MSASDEELDLTVGDVVSVIGIESPEMTVVKIERAIDGGTIWCLWFDSEDRLQQARFAPELLVR